MTLSKARCLRDEITRTRNLACVVPMVGASAGPNRFKARIWGLNGQNDFGSRAEWLEYRRGMDQRKKLLDAEIEAAGGEQAILDRSTNRPQPRSPLDIMIDRACGLGWIKRRA